MKKRLLAILLALTLVVSLMPVGALADDSERFVNLRLIDQSAWEDATFERAGEDKGGTIQVRGIRVYDTDDAYTNSEMYPAVGYYYTFANYEVGSGKSGKLDYTEIDRIVVAFTQDGQAVEAVFHRDEFDVKFVNDTVKHVEVTLRNTQTPAGPAVWFYAPIGEYTPQTYFLYDVVYLNGASTIGDNMPSLTNFGSTYDLVCWQVGKDGPEFTADTVVTSDIDVYAKKVTSDTDAEHIRAQNNKNLIFRKALEAYNATYSTNLQLDDITVKAVSVYGTSTETNPYYDGVLGPGVGANANKWHDDYGYYSIFNINSDIEELTEDDERYNERVAPDDIKGIRLYAEVNGEEFVCSIPRSELDVRVENVTWVNIFLREDSEPDVEPVTPPEPNVVDIFGSNVLVDCVNDEVDHNNAVYALKDGFYTVKQDVTAGANGTYTYVITVDAQEYCDYYRRDIKHRLAEGQAEDIDVTFTWANGVWTCDYGSAKRLVIEVVCETPEVDYNGDAITIAVNLDGETVNAEDYITVERYTSDSTYNHFIRVTDVSDNYKNMLVYDFDVAPYGINYYLNCTSIKVNVIGDYIVQGISSNQSYGKGEGYNVAANADGSYIVYNVADGVSDVDATIYLRTKYDVEYYVDKEPYGNDDNVYVKSYGVSVTSGSIEPNQQDKSMYWKNPDCSNEIKLIDLPDNAEGWYAYNDGNKLTGTVMVADYLPTGNSTTIKFYANTSDPATPETTDYLAGFFVLMPEKMDDSFVPGGVYPTDSYYPNAEGDTVTIDSKEQQVDDTTGYIGYLTEAGYKYFLEMAEVDDYDKLEEVVRVEIPADKVNEYLIVPKGSELGTVWTDYLSKSGYELVCYQINNSTLGADWPYITEKNGTQYDTYDGKTFHVDCYISNVEVSVIYDPNGGTGEPYTASATTGKPYTVLGNDTTNFTRDGYEFAGWSTTPTGGVEYVAGYKIDTLKTETILYAVWEAVDQIGGGDDGREPDGTPDYKQVVIQYVSADETMGTVKPEFEVVTFGVDANGNVVVEDVPLSGSAAAYEGYAFVNWTNELGVFADTASLTDYVLKAASIEAGKIYTYTAHFAVDKIGGGNDGDGPDGTPDYKQVVIRYVSADETMGTVKPEFEVVTFGVDANGNVVVEDVELSGVATPKEGYAFVNWTGEQFLAETASLSGYVLKAASIEAGKIYTYTAHFEKAAPDPITDADLAGVKVVLDCIDNVGHADGNYTLTLDMLKDGSVGPITANEDGTYSCTVKVHAAKFVTEYSRVHGLHWLVEGQEDPQTVEMTWTRGEGWSADPTTLTFEVTSKPDAPTVEDFDRLDLKVQIDCVGVARHPNRDYEIEKDTFTGEVEYVDGVWEYAVQVTGNTYLDKYETEFGEHTFKNGSVKGKTLVWDAMNKSWQLKESGNDRVAFDVVCVVPDAPTPEQAAKLFDVKVYCLTSENWGEFRHNSMQFKPFTDSLEISGVSYEDGNWTCTVTLPVAPYIEKFNETYGDHTNAGGDTKSKTLILTDEGWQLDNPSNDVVEINVRCTEPEIPTEEEIVDMFDGKGTVQLDCVTSGMPHNSKTYDLLEDSFVIGEPVQKDNRLTLPLTISIDEYLPLYEEVYGDHDVNDQQKTTYDVYWNGEEWTFDREDLPLVALDVECGNYEATITAANIIAYTGGEAYSHVVDASGNVIAEASGLPQPGFHITLSADTQKWLQKHGIQAGDGSTTGAANLEKVLKFVYDVDGVTREWGLEYVGVYSTNAQGEATAYVYSLTPGKTQDGTEIPVRVRYMNGDQVVSSDDILMNENYVNDTFTMVIEPGELDQGAIKGKFEASDGSFIYAEVEIGTGKLTVLSTTDEEYSHPIGTESSTDITAEVNGSAEFTVNDSQVIVNPEDVHLLVDEVSNNDGFNSALEETAREHAEMPNAASESFYLDLVHQGNGNVKVGLNGSLTINWPMPANADPNGDFKIVHYVDMDRTDTVGLDELDGADKQVIEVKPENGSLSFNVTSFSPFVLVYETKSTTPVVPPVDDDDDDEVYVPNWLNTTDHYAYIVGYEDGMIKPGNNITRAEVATIFFRLLTDNARERFWSTTNEFSDVNAGSWYNNAISTLSNMGIITGYDDGTFKPNAQITRAEFVTIATRFFSYKADYDGAFKDVSYLSWYADYVQAAVDMGLVSGYPDGSFRPGNNITRAEAVTIVNRVLHRVPHEDHLLALSAMNVWPDNPYGTWYYADMQEATNSHSYKWIRVSGALVEDWTGKLAERDWAALESEWANAHSK